MIKGLNKPIVIGVREQEKDIITTVRDFILFKVKNKIITRCDTIANDIYVETEHPIRDIYLNGKKINPTQ